MGKRIIKKITVCLLVLAMGISAVFAFAGCNLVVENENRVANQVIATINGAGGITMTVTQNELMDYYNTYAYYLTSESYGYGYTPEEAFDWCLENKIKSKYLVTEAMVYLADSASTNPNLIARNQVRYNPNALVNPEDCLTYAEYIAAIYSTNQSIKSTLDSYMAQSHQDKLQSDANDISKTDIDYIEFSDDTKAYLKDVYYVKEKVDKDKIWIHVVYDNGDKSDDFIVPDSLYTTDITTEEAKTDSSFVISVDEKIVDENGDSSYEAHTLTHNFDVVAPRATRTVEETTDDDEIAIGDVKLHRYETKAAVDAKLAAADVSVVKIDPQAEYSRLKALINVNADEVDAYRQLVDNLKNGNKDMGYYYRSSIESAVLSALQIEVKKEAVASNPVTDAQILEVYKYLYRTGKDAYDAAGNDEDAILKAFGDSIKSGIESLYYYPDISGIKGDDGNNLSLSDYFFVYQLLCKFSDEQTAFLTSVIGSDKSIAQQYYEFAKADIKVKESNPDYDPESEDEAKQNPYIIVDGKQKEVSFTDIYNALQSDLKAIYDDAALSEAERSSQALEKFLEYVYKYNDDPGVMNSSSGYVIGPANAIDPNGSFDTDFLALARDVFAYNNSVGNAFTADGKLGYKMTSFGAHIIMISMTPFADDQSTEGFLDKTDAELLTYLKAHLININGEDLYSKIKADLVNDLKTNAYSKFTNSKVKADLKDDENIVQIDTKKYEKMVKDYTGG